MKRRLIWLYSWLAHFVTFVFIWTVAGMAAETSGVMTDPWGWMFLGWCTVKAAGIVADKVKFRINSYTNA